jgi:hypothetical protein
MRTTARRTRNEQEGMSLKEILLYTFGGITLLGGGFMLTRFLVKKFRENKEQDNSMDEGAAATYAKEIKMAFDNDGWYGTNTNALRSTLHQVPTQKAFEDVKKSYQRLYSSNLLKDMSDELQSSEYKEMQQIISAKPKKQGQVQDNSVKYNAWAQRLKAAFDKEYGFIPGTDENAIRTVFNEIPTQKDFAKVGEAYKHTYGRDITVDLKSELELYEYGDYMKIITDKPKF